MTRDLALLHMSIRLFQQAGRRIASSFSRLQSGGPVSVCLYITSPPTDRRSSHLCHLCVLPRTSTPHVRSANLPSFSIVPVMPLPISAALRANSDRAPFLAPLASPLGDPFAALLCESGSRNCLCWPIFVDDCRFCACARTALNSAVRSCTDVEVISATQGAPAGLESVIFRRYT